MPATPIAALSLSTALAYALLAFAHRHLSAVQARWGFVAVWVLHALVLLFGWTDPPPRFGFASALSLTVWLVLAVHGVESRVYPQLRTRWTLAAMGSVAVLLAWVFPGAPFPHLPSAWLPLHWAFGMAAYGLIAAAVVHAWLMQRAERAMRRGLGTEAGLPLLTLERLTFRLVSAGFVLLSATLVAGAWFSNTLYQHMSWNHKTVFSVLAWLTMGVLLWGRWRLGWRGRTAVRTLYAGAGLLLLGYAGSRFVMEVLLHRA
jgi:ABC-type uncharacterized transport system permease subunit